MIIIAGTDYTIIAACIAAAGLFFAVQLILCCKAKTSAAKLVPAFLILILLLLAAALYAGMFGHGEGFIPSNAILALVIALPAGAALTGDALAWIVYVLRARTSNDRKNH